ncbi:13098_t:CDS:2 [Ambispora leptoticha]|uniref:13098_t:CDS:1 n=1 Tax=Ambispora leptoticha TaxID=144679 RepID=A0A9N9G0E0_9GLOM|nr:13098_t:CDS:2 [Ambispora leptoticha]
MADNEVVLKSLNNSQNITAVFLHEITNHILCSSDQVVKCYGISQNPQTKDYLMICEGLRPQFKIKVPSLLEDLISKCWDADPAVRPTASELKGILGNWSYEILDENSEFGRQYEEAERFNKNNLILFSYQAHPQAIYTSRLLDFKNLPEPQNSKKINDQFYSQLIDISSPLEVNSLSIGLSELSLEDTETEQEETIAQIQIPPK